jgi:hypothetical protein
MSEGTESRNGSTGVLAVRWPGLLCAGLLVLCAAACSSSSPGTDAPDAPDVTDAPDAPDVTDVPEAPDVPDVPDVTGPFHWASGCEGTATRDAWSSIPVTDTTFPRGPLVQMADRDGATLVWRTATPSVEEGCVDVAWGQEQRTVCGSADANGQYEVPVYGLPPATEITYAVRVGEIHTPQLTFRTLPDRPVAMKFAVFADAHNNVESLQKMSVAALAEGVDFAIGVGDLTGSGQVVEFDQTFQGFRDLGTRVNIWAVIGNHDEKSITGYTDAFVLPEGNEDEAATGLGEAWWSRRIGNVWIGGGYIRDYYLSPPDVDWGQVGWFRRQFQTEEFLTARWKLFFIHEPPWVASGGGDCNYYGENSLQQSLIPMLAAAGVQASFHGHMHGIEWGDVGGVRTYVVGGVCGCGLDTGACPLPEGLPRPWNALYEQANFAIVETGCDGLTVRHLDLDGTALTTHPIVTTP